MAFDYTLTDGVGDEFPLLESDALDDFSVDPASSSLESSFNEDSSRSEILWPSIASSELIDDFHVEEAVVKVDESEWPSISADPMQEEFVSSIPVENPEPPIQINKNSSKDNDVDLALPLNNSFDQPEEIDQSNAEGSVSATLSTESTSDPVSQDVMPDLTLCQNLGRISQNQTPNHQNLSMQTNRCVIRAW